MFTKIINAFMKNIDKSTEKTPSFYISKQKILDNVRNYQKCFPGALIHYAMKANFEQQVLKTIFEAGCSFEVATVHELKMLIDIGVTPEKIIYGTSVKPEDQIKKFYDYGVDRFAFDCFSELEKIAKVAPKSRVYARLKVEDQKSVFKLSEKFSTEKENIVPLLKCAKELGLHPYGISFNVGSQSSDPLAWANAVKEIQQPLQELKELGIILDVINIGGGFPCDSYLKRPADMPLKISLEEIANTTLIEINKLPYQPKIMLEPGRGIIADAVILIVTIFAKVERKDRTWLFLDAGVYSGLFESMAYQGNTCYKITPEKKIDNGENISYALAGPSGDSPDVITREILLPKNLKVGDKLIIHDIGAYSLPTITPFHGMPKPCVFYV